MKFTKPFREISKHDVAIAGGKGASLGEMTRAGISVPPGFVVLSNGFERFLEETGIDLEIESEFHKLDHNDVNSVELVSEKLRGLITEAEFPKDLGKEVLESFAKLKAKNVAVRSSATAEDSSIASWAGELETYLNVQKKEVLDSVKKCWASLFTPRAIFYRFEKNMHKTKVSVAVVIQKMIESEISGVCFTVHPVTKDYDQLIIEGVYGLGEAIVSGKVTPDSYVVHTSDWHLMHKNIAEQEMMTVKTKKGTIEAKVPKAKQGKQKLPDKKVLELARLCKKIEIHYGKPQDIEWAAEKNKLYILQSRPITTL